MPTAREVPDTGTKASDLSAGSSGIPLIPSWTEYSRKEPIPAHRQDSTVLFTAFLLYVWLCLWSGVLPSQDCCPVFRLYPAVHMQALVVWEVGRHSWEQSPLLLLQRLIPAKGKREIQWGTKRKRNIFLLWFYTKYSTTCWASEHDTKVNWIEIGFPTLSWYRTTFRFISCFFFYLSARPHHRSSCAS